MKKIPLPAVSLLLALLLLCPACSLEKREKPGALDPYWDVIWDGDVYLENDHMIGSENTLVIRSGARIHFARPSARVALIVYGGFEILGDQDDKVTFLNDNGLTNEIYILSYPQYTGNSFAWADLGDIRLVTKMNLSMTGCRVGSLEARDSARISLSRCVVGTLDCANFSRLAAEYTSFDRSSFPSLSSGNLNLVVGGLSSAVAHHCNFMGSSSLLLSPVPIVEDYTSTNIDLSGNYWRTGSSSYINSTLVFNDGFGSFQTSAQSAVPFPVE